MEHKGENRNQKIAAGVWILLGAMLVICLAFFLRTLKETQEAGLTSDDNGRILAVNVREEEMAAPLEKTIDGTVSDRSGSKDTEESEEDYPDKCGLDRVDRPMQRSSREVLARLRELGEDNELIEDIVQNRSDYPERVLEALANNPEMADFVSHWNGLEKAASGGITDSEKMQEFPLFLQWDPRWGYVEYGDESCIALSGCGPTCLSMALYYLTDDEDMTPDKVGQYSMENGHYISGTGTAWALMEDMAAECGVDCRQSAATEEGMKEALDNGAIIILSMGPGEFTAAGHFIVVYGYDRHGFMVNDPNCVARSRSQWNYSELERQIKNMWVLSNESADSHHGDTEIAENIR